MINGLTTVNIELTSRCNKNCWMCGRRKIEKDFPELVNWGDMDFSLLEKIAPQIPEGIVIQFHNNGEPLLYPKLKEALELFPKNIRCFNTNAKLLLEKADDIIDNMETLTISIIKNDPEGEEQYEIVKKFLEIKGERKPFMVYRLLGTIENSERWYSLPGVVATRILHSPMGSRNYTKTVTVPEIGICWDILSHLVINRMGLVSCCVRFDVEGELIIGNVSKESLLDIWNGEKRKLILQKHIEGKRKDLNYCGKKCDYYGIPKG